MFRSRAVVGGWSALTVLGLAACTGSGSTPVDQQTSVPPAATGTPSPSVPTGAPVPSASPLPAEEPLPVTEDAGYADAVATFGADAVQAALATDARIARTALADCHLWRTGQIDPGLRDLLDPALLTEIEAELARPDGYPRTLLAPLPDDDGNGHNLAAAVRGGCDASAPLHAYVGTFTMTAPQLVVHVERTGAQPALVVAGAYVMNVTLGDVRVAAGQDWQFASVPGPAGWRLVDVQTGGSHVNWAPPLTS